MAGEFRRVVGLVLETLDLSFGKATRKAGLLDLSRLPGDQPGQGGGGEVKLGSGPGPQAIVSEFTANPQLRYLLYGKLSV